MHLDLTWALRAGASFATASLLAWAGLYCVDPPPPVVPDGATEDITIHLCRPPDAQGTLRGWSDMTRIGAERLRRLGAFGAPDTVSVEETTATDCLSHIPAGETCHGGTGDLYCDEELVSPMLNAIAWMIGGATSHINTLPGVPGRSPLESLPSTNDALELAAASSAGDDNKIARMCAFRLGHGTADQSWILCGLHMQAIPVAIWRDESGAVVDDSPLNPLKFFKPGDPMVRLARALYRQSSDALLAFIIGHETFHARRGVCPRGMQLPAPLAAEFDALSSLQGAGRVVCPTDEIDPKEHEADRCGLAVMSMIEGLDATEWKHVPDAIVDVVAASAGDAGAASPRAMLLALSRRVAVDAFTWLVSLGIGHSPFSGLTYGDGGDPDVEGGAPPTHLKLKVVFANGYLASPFRTALFASVLHGATNEMPGLVRICNDSAQVLYGAVEAARQCGLRHPDSRAPLAPLLADVLPPGVIAAWQADRMPTGEDTGCDDGVGRRSTIAVTW